MHSHNAHSAFDPAVFYIQEKYEERFGKSLSIRSLVERPKLYIIATGSSSVDNRIRIIQDNIDCLHELSTNVTTSNGIVMRDKLLFFVGDHPAQQFERGTPLGRKFKCGGCGVRDIIFRDLAHTLQYSWHGIQDLQRIATAG